MKEFIDKLITRIMLESASCKVYKLINPNKEDIAEFNAYKKCIEIINELAEEYINTSTDTSTDTSTTNADRIRSMTDEELAEFLGGIDHTIDDCEFVVKIGDEWLHDSTADILDWLQSEVEGVTENE